MTVTIDDFNNLALEQLGIPYVYGGIELRGTARPGVDCSGLPYAICLHFGVMIPRTSSAQFHGLPSVGAGSLRRGDLVFYNVVSDAPPQPAHVAVWWNASGSQAVLEAPHTGEDVKFSTPLPYPIMGYGRLPFPGAGGVTTTTPQNPTIQLGSTGVPVILAQQCLVKDNQHIVVDGVFGPNTEAAVKNIQRFFKLTVDGVVGPITWSYLLIR